MSELKRNPDHMMGLKFVGRGSLGWAWQGGYLRWLPYRGRKAVVTVWNWLVCFVRGHNTILRGIKECERDGTYPCPDCCKRLPVTR